MSEKKQRFVTPVGEAKWAWLTKPKVYKDETGREQGTPKYQIEVYFEATNPEWVDWCKKLRAAIEAVPATIDRATGKPMPKQMPIKWELDENDQKTNRLFVAFKTSDKFKPGIFDKYGKAVADGVLIGNGSKVRVNYSPNEYTAFGGGVNLYLNAVQVLELVEYKSQSAEAFGFNVEPEPVGAGASGAAKATEDDLPF